MKTIWKFEIKIVESQTIMMPRHAEILTAQEQHGFVYLWAIVDPLQEKEGRLIEIFGTGQAFKVEQRAYIGTVQMDGGNYVFHVFERL